MIYNQKDIPELNIFLHRNDSVTKKYMDYEKVILDKTLSPYLYSNNRMATFLNKLNGLVSLFFDQFNVLKNWKNFTVDKYYYRHSN